MILNWVYRRASFKLRLIWWRVRRWYLQQMVLEAARNMTRSHWNIARNDLDDHMRKRPKE